MSIYRLPCRPCPAGRCRVCVPGTTPREWQATLAAPSAGLCEDCPDWEGDYFLAATEFEEHRCSWEYLFPSDFCGVYCGMRLTIEDQGDGLSQMRLWLLERATECEPPLHPLGWEGTFSQAGPTVGTLDCELSRTLFANDQLPLSTACGWPETISVVPHR